MCEGVKQSYNLSFSDLIIQNNAFQYNSGYTHYIHKPSNKIYSWSDISHCWETFSDEQLRSFRYTILFPD